MHVTSVARGCPIGGDRPPNLARLAARRAAGPAYGTGQGTSGYLTAGNVNRLEQSSACGTATGAFLWVATGDAYRTEPFSAYCGTQGANDVWRRALAHGHAYCLAQCTG